MPRLVIVILALLLNDNLIADIKYFKLHNAIRHYYLSLSKEEPSLDDDHLTKLVCQKTSIQNLLQLTSMPSFISTLPYFPLCSYDIHSLSKDVLLEKFDYGPDNG